LAVGPSGLGVHASSASMLSGTRRRHSSSNRAGTRRRSRPCSAMPRSTWRWTSTGICSRAPEEDAARFDKLESDLLVAW